MASKKNAQNLAPHHLKRTNCTINLPLVFTILVYITTEECQIVGKQFSVGEELCRLDDVGMRMHFIPYRKNVFPQFGTPPPSYS